MVPPCPLLHDGTRLHYWVMVPLPHCCMIVPTHPPLQSSGTRYQCLILLVELRAWRYLRSTQQGFLVITLCQSLCKHTTLKVNSHSSQKIVDRSSAVSRGSSCWWQIKTTVGFTLHFNFKTQQYPKNVQMSWYHSEAHRISSWSCGFRHFRGRKMYRNVLKVSFEMGSTPG